MFGDETCETEETCESTDLSKADKGAFGEDSQNELENRESIENNDAQETLVGFSTGDEELDRLIGGISDNAGDFVADDSVAAKSEKSEKNAKVADDSAKNAVDSGKGDFADSSENGDDYSYYGTIKPLAENAGLPSDVGDSKKSNDNDAASQKAEDILKAEIERAKILAENEKAKKISENERIKTSLNAVKEKAILIVDGIKKSVIGVYDEIFKNNPAFKTPIESVVKNLEEYVQALLLSRALLGEANYECYPEFVYEILPEGDIFVGTFDDLSLNVKLAAVLKTQPTAMLMLAAVDVSFNRSETKKLIDDVYSLYLTCVNALGQKAPSKDEVMFNMLTFAKNQGVVL